jgi:hypothetical protein
VGEADGAVSMHGADNGLAEPTMRPIFGAFHRHHSHSFASEDQPLLWWWDTSFLLDLLLGLGDLRIELST